MTGRRLVVVFGVAVALVAVALLVEVAIPRWKAERQARERVLWSGRTELSPFSIERDGATYHFERRASGAWAIETRGPRREIVADVRAVDDLKRALSGFGGIKTVLADKVTDVPDLAPYGLATQRLVLRWTDDWEHHRSLAIGNLLAGGGQAAAILDGTRLVLVPREIKEVVDRDLSILRDKTVLSLPWADVVGLDIVRRRDLPAGASREIVLQRHDDPGEEAWRVVVPAALDANPVRVRSIVSKLASLSSVGFGAEAPSPDDLAKVGLSPAGVSVTIMRSGGAAPVTIELGDSGGEKICWAWDHAGPLVQVRSDLRADLLLADDFFRDNRPIRIPREEIVNLRFDKGAEKSLALEIQKDDVRGWYVVKPAEMTLQPDEAATLLDLLDQILCGRFEDAMAEDPGAAPARWDFNGPGSLRLQVSALRKDGRPRHVDLDATPFTHERTAYQAVRAVDQDLKEEVCIAPVKAFDPFVERARAIVQRAVASGPPVPSGDTGAAGSSDATGSTGTSGSSGPTP